MQVIAKQVTQDNECGCHAPEEKGLQPAREELDLQSVQEQGFLCKGPKTCLLSNPAKQTECHAPCLGTGVG